MSHLTTWGVPCALPDAHKGYHRSVASQARAYAWRRADRRRRRLEKERALYHEQYGAEAAAFTRRLQGGLS